MMFILVTRTREQFKELAKISSNVRKIGPRAQAILREPRQEMKMQMFDRLLGGLSVCVKEIKAGRRNSLSIALEQHLHSGEQICAEFGRAVSNVGIMVFAGNQGVAVNVGLDREEADKIV